MWVSDVTLTKCVATTYLDPRINVIIPIFQKNKDKARLSLVRGQRRPEGLSNRVQCIRPLRVGVGVGQNGGGQKIWLPSRYGDSTFAQFRGKTLNEAYQILILRALDGFSSVLDNEDPPARNNCPTMELDIEDVPATVSRPSLPDFVAETRRREFAAGNIGEFVVNLDAKSWNRGLRGGTDAQRRQTPIDNGLRVDFRRVARVSDHLSSFLVAELSSENVPWFDFTKLGRNPVRLLCGAHVNHGKVVWIHERFPIFCIQ